MCFSASASFAAAAVLSVVGILLLTRIENKRYLPLALVPLFFAIQQAAEGFLWLDFAANSFQKDLYLFFAFVLWPLWIPFSLWLAEENGVRKQALTLCWGVGIVMATLLAFSIPSVSASVRSYSIHYTYPLQFNMYNTLFGFYATATVVPFFISSLPKTTLFGVLFGLTALLIGWIDRTFFISVWCFVAAVVSVGLFWILKPKKTH